jgi:hypothetical protein
MDGRRCRDVARMAEQICDAARLAALDAIDTAARIALDRSAEASNHLRGVADRVLYRAAVMQAELNQFISVVRRRW